MSRNTNSGFTLVELIIVIVLLGIVSVTALPRFFDKAGVEEATVQDQFISVLRRMQNQAMQQTEATFCHQLVLTPTQLGYPDSNECLTNPSLSTSAQDSGLRFRLGATSTLVLSAFSGTDNSALSLPYSFRFNSLGQPVNNNREPLAGLRFVITGPVSYSICIEAEGYIHSC